MEKGIEMIRWAGHVARMGERRGAYRALVGKPEGRRSLGRPRRRWDARIQEAKERDTHLMVLYRLLAIRSHSVTVVEISKERVPSQGVAQEEAGGEC
jgi:hypothetical protein